MLPARRFCSSSRILGVESVTPAAAVRRYHQSKYAAAHSKHDCDRKSLRLSNFSTRLSARPHEISHARGLAFTRKFSSSAWIPADSQILKESKRVNYTPETAESRRIKVRWKSEGVYLKDDHGRGWRFVSATTLRDSCACSSCRDSSSGQKSFGTTEIPPEITLDSLTASGEGLVTSISPEIPREGTTEPAHQTVVPWETLEVLLGRRTPGEWNPPRRRFVAEQTGVEYWDARTIGQSIRKLDYNDYMHNEDLLWEAVVNISRLGIVFIKNVPEDQESVIRVTTRIANIQETFYGRTFDVKAKPNAENVAYTNDYLGLHQDLLYLNSPPRIQVLHCMENSCEGGESLFSDGERVARSLFPFLDRPSMVELKERAIPYAYDKHGFSYQQQRSLFDFSDSQSHHPASFKGIWWSPPFQAPILSASTGAGNDNLTPWILAARIFDQLINQESAMYKYKMLPGECVLFDNRRVMHGRTAFDMGSGGSRWLRGAYISEEDFVSRATHIPKDKAREARGREATFSAAELQQSLAGTAWHQEAETKIEQMEKEHY